uniref:Large ribosomal subunit protein uL22c n=1 Tax=Bostrychia simpliciuscula TaxID=324754 RepID=A0A1Z1M8K7_9FLOR|nr:ribosomal protein L22 [Bostrychia simpliciuscula]ARW62125.1 ribosomal protein L22 [Bostrychia simpliciuscula]
MNDNIITSHAIAKYIRVSTHKSQRVLKQIKGKNYDEARLILKFMPYRVCKTVSKVLESALNNILQQKSKGINKKELIVKEAFADKGPTLKRFQPRAQGRAFPIHKPTCHITIKLEIK